MRYILSLLLCSTIAVRLPAQIILSSTDYPVSEIGADSLKITTVGSSFPVLNAMPNGMWDMSAVSDTSPVYFAYRVNGDAGYQFADSNVYSIGGYIYLGNVQSNIIGIGIEEYSIEIQKAEISLYSLTGNPPDSLIIAAQDVSYSSPRAKIAFPATDNSSWQSAYNYDLAFQLSYLAVGDTLAPGVARTYITEKDSVVGWGEMRVKDATGAPSDYNNVLQVQTMIVRTDSFFLKGAPFPGFLLTSLSLFQGKHDTTYEQNYYRRGEVTPLAEVAFRDAAFTTPYKATTHVQRLSTASVKNVTEQTDISIYPNPGDGAINIGLSDPGGRWAYELFTQAGQKILDGVLQPAKNNVAQVKFPPGLVEGLYYITITHNNEQVAVKALTLRAN